MLQQKEGHEKRERWCDGAGSMRACYFYDVRRCLSGRSLGTTPRRAALSASPPATLRERLIPPGAAAKRKINFLMSVRSGVACQAKSSAVSGTGRSIIGR